MANLRPVILVLPEQLGIVERHAGSDEVYVLFESKVILVIAGRGAKPGPIQVVRMAQSKLYNVRRDTRYNALLGRESQALVVENRDTGAANTQPARLSLSQRSRVREIWEPGG